MDNNCESYWSLSDRLPVDVAVDYWCSDQPGCREAKRYALLSALERGDVTFQRSDGKTFDDPVNQLYERGLILVDRDSFLDWANQISDDTGKKNLREQMINSRSESSYLKTIGAMINLMLDSSAGGQKHCIYQSQSAIINAILSHNSNIDGISQRTLEAKFSAGKKELSSN